MYIFSEVLSHPKATLHFCKVFQLPPACPYNKSIFEPTSVIIHLLRVNFFFCSLPLTRQPPSPTNRELYSSWPGKHVREIQTNKAHTCIISLPEVAWFLFLEFFIAVISSSSSIGATTLGGFWPAYCRYLHLYLYSLPLHLCQCVNIYSNWLTLWRRNYFFFKF